jgi:hypothetical protein
LKFLNSGKLLNVLDLLIINCLWYSSLSLRARIYYYEAPNLLTEPKPLGLLTVPRIAYSNNIKFIKRLSCSIFKQIKFKGWTFTWNHLSSQFSSSMLYLFAILKQNNHCAPLHATNVWHVLENIVKKIFYVSVQKSQTIKKFFHLLW